jgi:hypothetical protein
MLSAIEQKAVNELTEEIIDEMKHESVTIQIRVAFTILTQVINDGLSTHPDEIRRELAELQAMMQQAHTVTS